MREFLASIVPADMSSPAASTMIMHALASRMFHAVRWAGSARGVLESGYFASSPGGFANLGPAASRAPAAISEAALDRDIEHRAVDAGLSSGKKPHGK